MAGQHARLRWRFPDRCQRPDDQANVGVQQSGQPCTSGQGQCASLGGQMPGNCALDAVGFCGQHFRQLLGQFFAQLQYGARHVVEQVAVLLRSGDHIVQ